MKLDILVPITLLICIVLAIRLVLDAMLRRHMINAGSSAELTNSILRHDAQRQRLSSLRWGIVLISIGFGFGVIQWLDWTELTPSSIGVLAGATGLGNLVFFAISRRMPGSIRD